MKLRTCLAAALLLLPAALAARQRGDERNTFRSWYTADYLAYKKKLLAEFAKAPAGRFSEFSQRTRALRGKDQGQKLIAFTFDACGGRHSGYNAKLIDYLRRERIPATLFVTGLWIEKNRETFAELAKEPLFEIENHGLLHRHLLQQASHLFQRAAAV